MRPKLRLAGVWGLVILSTGCSIAYDLVAPVANFGLGLYNADTYVTKDCQWYEPVWFSPEMKDWIKNNNPPSEGIKDLAKVARNNDLFKEVCKQ